MKPYDTYQAYIFDLDGTLYDQGKLRLGMLKRLIGYYIRHPFRVRELLVLFYYRKQREKADEASGYDKRDLIQSLARRFHMSPRQAEKALDYWLLQNPLDLVRKCADADLLMEIKELRKQGKVVVVYSDYPTADKLRAMGVKADYEFSPEDPAINCLKPNPDGLKQIISVLNLPVNEILFIGDREEKDGACAKAAGMDFMLKRKPWKELRP